MKKQNNTAGLTATESIGVTEMQKRFYNGVAGTLRLPVGDFEVIKQTEGFAVVRKQFSELLVRHIRTGKEYLIPTGNAQLIFGLEDN